MTSVENKDLKAHHKDKCQDKPASSQAQTADIVGDDGYISKGFMDEMMECFSLFDKNSDQKLCLRELGPVMRALGQNPTEEYIRHIMEVCDKDGNDMLDYDEYRDLLKQFLRPLDSVALELREACRVFDKDRNNRLNLRELSLVLTKIGDNLSRDEVKELCAMMNHDGNMEVDIDTFVDFICRRY